ncbi:MAG: NAD(P)H-hydrate dehydratase [Lachnospiraceae bacterium]|nr:NAD(P)H-hydrate dehydratase [Lachnospiraceae bacterium]
MKWISTAEQMRQADLYAVSEMKVPSLLLMEAAARAVADRLSKVCKKDDDILFLCGSGNNGGDGFACARMMKHRGFSVRVFCMTDPRSLSGDARVNYDMLSEYGVSVLTQDQASAFNHIAEQSEWVVDALLGTGLNKPLRGFYLQVVSSINKLKKDGIFKVLSIDIPSGVDADTGKVLGEAIHADETITFCRLKPGLMLFPGCDCAGKVSVADIGIPETIPPLARASMFSMDPEDLRRLVPERKSRSHKGLYGRVLAVCGSKTMTGAAVFTASGAYRTGAGLVECAIPEGAAEVFMGQIPEAITYAYKDDAYESFEWVGEKVRSARIVACGPGLSKAPYAKKLLKKLLQTAPSRTPLILDADALNLLAEDESLKELLAERGGNTVLTPHMGEASRLLGKSIEEISADPLIYVRELAETYHAVTVLKDARTLVAEQEGRKRVFFNTTGNNGMSKGGSGDVLTGIIAGLLAQGMEPFDAACCGTYIHGAAGDRARKQMGSYSMLPTDTLNCLNVESILTEGCDGGKQ